MAIAITLLVLLIASAIFNFTNPWQATEVASNWGSIDVILYITAAICGVVFVLVTLFMIWSIYKYRNRDGHNSAHYEPDNKKLETWLTILTSIGIIGMLAPGLLVYGDFVNVPEEATEIEVFAKQWSWSYRLPGEDGQLGKSSIRKISATNPFGLDENDPAGQDDILISSSELHVPINKPVKMVLRSQDVLHNYYVPQIRAKMDIVPGQISYFWFEPTEIGRYEVLCAELCGVGHYNMRGILAIDSQTDYDSWLKQQSTFAKTLAEKSNQGLVGQGEQLAQNLGCLACHSIDGSQSLGPGWQGLYGSEETLEDGTVLTVDDAYLIESIVEPAKKIVKGYANVMVPYQLNDSQISALIAYTRSLSESPSSKGSIIEQGRNIAEAQGCFACHSSDGSKSLGPTWKGLYGKTELLSDGSSINVDDDYLRESITNPNESIVKGYNAIMPSYELSTADLDAIVEYTKSLNPE